MKLFNAEQIYTADKLTIARQGISSDELMERAAIQVFNWLHSRLQGAPVKIHLFCGIGNNGGDGMAVARHLTEHGYNINVYVVNYSKSRSQDFLINLERLKERKIWPEFLDATSENPNIGKEDILIDAIFGIGLNRPPDDWVGKLMKHLNESKAFILSVDTPSGLFTDKVPVHADRIIKATHVLSFQAPKLVFFLPETGIYVNQWEVLNIGLDHEYLQHTDTVYELVGKHEILPLYMPRERFSHKGTYGHSLIIGGSYGKIGAVILTTKACLHAGSGLVTAYVPQCGYSPIQTAVPESMVITDKGENHLSHIAFEVHPTAIGLGIGMGTDAVTVKAFANFLEKNKVLLVVDADGLNMLSKNKELLHNLPKKSVLTPHPKELERLIGKWRDDFDKLEKVMAFSKQYDCIVVIKGAHTITVYEGKGYVNNTGNPGMATAGSGDALTGIITGLIAQGYDSLSAAIFGVYLHGRSGDIAVEETGYQSLSASDLIANLGKAYIDLFSSVPTPESQEEVDDSQAK